MQTNDLRSQTPSTRLVRNAVISAAVVAAVAALQGCITDPDCGVCDPDNLVLETISAVNYAGKAINVLSPKCEGDNCPEPFTEGEVFVTDIGLCQETDDALDSPRGVDEWCKISPMIVDDGINFIFNNLLEPTSVELVRKQPDNPQLYEVYDWRTKILSIEGPVTRFNGDYLLGTGDDPDLMLKSVNLSCIENLAALGVPFNHESPAEICDAAGFQNGNLFPLRMQVDGEIKTYGGETDTRSSANSCDTPDSGPDTCCTACDYDMSVNVAKYGLDEGGVPRTPNGNGPAAIQCDPQGDKLVDCAGFIPYVNREDEVRTYRYTWAGEGPGEYKLPWQDRLRETHPNFRPNAADFAGQPGLVGFEQATVPCGTTADCSKVPGLTGTECVGHYEGSSTSCSVDSMDTACVERVCRQPWFVRCAVNSNTLGNVGYCVDTRFSDKGAMSCFQAPPNMIAYLPEDEGGAPIAVSGRLANADTDESGALTATEACPRDGGGVPINCDPLFLDGTGRVNRYDRNATLPDETRGCICRSVADDDPCAAIIAETCTDENGNVRPEREGEYALKFVSRAGGVIYDPAIKGVQFRPADRGGVVRARVEACAEARTSDTVDVDDFNIEDGWRANDAFAEVFDNFDRALCSSSEYTVKFATSGDSQFIQDKVGNTLDGKDTYKFETPDFHILPGSGFPTDNLRIGACDEFELRFSNKFDLSKQNLKKVEIVELVAVGEDDEGIIYDVAQNMSGGEKVVAGGVNCAEINDDVSVDNGAPPCLTVDVANQRNGQVRVYVDYSVYDKVTLSTGTRYRMRVPGLNNLADAQDPALYNYAFWDACGMPLILGGHEGAPDYHYDFTVDEPKRKEDPDNDKIPLSCDNANDYYNPNQEDTDGDGIGDVYDLCLTIPSSSDDSADSDRDGIGNNCDTCTRTAKNYNSGFEGDYYMRVRNIPDQTDSDGDGIGDVCDNCSVRANCANYNEVTPWKVGDPIDVLDVNSCQTDNDAFPSIGDSCNEDGVLVQDPGAAGPVGLGEEDDFDQDGIANIRDYCPRQKPEFQETCANDSECTSGICSADGVCNHLDSDGDTVGDKCDTCPQDANPMQILEGSDEEDDSDGDFVGKICETNAECTTRRDPKPYALYDVSVNGQCCVIQFDPEVNRLDPDCNVLRADCTDTEMCRELPDVVKEREGMISLPTGCEQALLDAGYEPGQQASRIEIPDDPTAEDLADAWSYLCFLPQRDQDFDGIGDACDKCRFAHDPNNEPFLDENGKLWPDLGKYCYGDYDPEKNSCGDDEEDTDGGTDTEGDTDTDTDTGTTG